MNWNRGMYSYLGPNGTKGGKFHFTLRISDDVVIWVKAEADGTYEVSKSTHLGNYKFEDEALKTGFRNAKQAREWAEQNI